MTNRRSSQPVLALCGLALALLAGPGARANAAPQTPLAVAAAAVLQPAIGAGSSVTQASTAAVSTPDDAIREIGQGRASWYGAGFAGRRTANGERFDPAGFTAAHRSLPFGSMVRVTALSNGRSVVVRINDRGPFSHARVIDVSQAAARELGLVAAGSGQVRLELVSG